MRTEVKLRDAGIPAIGLADVAKVELSDKFLTLSTFYKSGENEQFDMILLNVKEAQQLKDFLNDKLKEEL